MESLDHEHFYPTLEAAFEGIRAHGPLPGEGEQRKGRAPIA